MYNTPLPGLLSIYRVKMSSVQIPVKYGAAGSSQSSPLPHTQTHTHTRSSFPSLRSVIVCRWRERCSASWKNRTLSSQKKKRKKKEKKDNEATDDAATSSRRSYSFAEGFPQNSNIYQGCFVIHSVIRRSFVISEVLFSFRISDCWFTASC